MTVDFEQTCRDFIARRVIVKADSPEGHRLSMAIEILHNIPKADNENQRTELIAAFTKLSEEIEQIRKDGGQYVHGNHGAQR